VKKDGREEAYILCLTPIRLWAASRWHAPVGASKIVVMLSPALASLDMACLKLFAAKTVDDDCSLAAAFAQVKVYHGRGCIHKPCLAQGGAAAYNRGEADLSLP
jgi:hypothetical protein